MKKFNMESIEREEQKKKISGEPAYFKVYTKGIGRIYGMTATQTGLLGELIKLSTYENTIRITTLDRKKIAQRLEVKRQSISNAISFLIKNDIIKANKEGAGEYYLNPNLVGRGSWNDIKELRHTWTIQEDGTETRKTEIIKK